MKFLKKEYRNKMSHPANNSAEWLLRYLGLNLALTWWHFFSRGCLPFLPNSKITVHGISDATSPLYNISMICLVKKKPVFFKWQYSWMVSKKPELILRKEHHAS